LKASEVRREKQPLLVKLALLRQRWFTSAVTGAFLGVLCAASSAAHAVENQPRGNQSPATATSVVDAEVRSNVVELLRRDGRVDAQHIAVSSSNGIVELSGTVGTQLSKDRAPRVAALARGVRLLVNRLRVAVARRPDRDIARDLRRALRAEPALAKMPIAVRVRHGVVTLTGAITSWTEQELAERVASSLSGVRFCLNNLTSRRAPRRTADVIASDVRSRLAWEPTTAHSPLIVSVARGVVFLSGSVSTGDELLLAVKDSRVLGVVGVDSSRVIVAPSPRSQLLRQRALTDRDIAAAVRDAIEYYWHAKPPQVQVRVAAGVVYLTGVVDTHAQAQAVETLARGASGSVDVRSDLRGTWWRPEPTPPPQTRRGLPRRR
jgi:hyperosmotically inducible protein